MAAEALTLEQEKALALARARKRKSEAEGDGVVTESLAGFYKGLAFGSPLIQSGMARAGLTYPPGEEPQSLSFAAGETVGMGLPLFAGGAGAGSRFLTAGGSAMARAAAPFAEKSVLPYVGQAEESVRHALELGGLGTKVVPRATGAVRGALEDVAKFTVRHPITAIGLEVGAGAAAGIGGELAAREYGEGYRPHGQLVGGFAPVGVTVGTVAGTKALGTAGLWVLEKFPTLGPAVTWLRTSVAKGLKTGSRRRAEERLQTATRDPEAAAREIVEGEFLPGLTPAQKAGEERLLSIEKSVLHSSEALKGEAAEQATRVNQVIRAELREVATGKPVTAEDQINGTNYLLDLLDTRVAIAHARAEQRLAKMGAPNRETINRVQREELEAAYRAARQQEKELWKAVPESLKLPIADLRAAYARMVRETPIAQQDQIPAKAVALLGPGSPFRNVSAVAAKELQGLRSDLLESARVAEAAGRKNEARLAGELADAVLSTLGAQANNIQGEVGQALRTALNFSRAKQEHFSRGTVGRLLGLDRFGGERVPDGLTLEAAIGMGGPKAREGADDLIQASRRFGNEQATRDAITDFLRDEFLTRATRDGKLVRGGYQTFSRRYKELFTRFPGLAADFEQTARLGLVVPPRKAVGEIMASPAPSVALRQYMQQNEGAIDTQGIKAGFLDHIITGAGVRDLADLQKRSFLSGETMFARMNDPKMAAVLRTLFTPEEMGRLTMIARTASRLERSLLANPDPEGIIRTAPNLITTIVAKVAGARFGGEVIAPGSMGGSLQTAGFISQQALRLAQRAVKDPATRLVIDAIGNGPLFAALLTSTTESPAAGYRASRMIHGWAASVVLESQESQPESR